MAYYGDGKHTFKSVIAKIKDPLVKDFLKYKWAAWWGDPKAASKGFIEQMLYNEDCDDIRKELSGFVAGRLYMKRSFPSVEIDIVLAQREIMPVLAKIYKEMATECKWGDDCEPLKEWELWLR
jgi:hypothetical protein